MIHAKKVEGKTGLFIDGSQEPDVLCNDDGIALKIVQLWNNNEMLRYEQKQNMIALERQPINDDTLTAKKKSDRS